MVGIAVRIDNCLGGNVNARDMSTQVQLNIGVVIKRHWLDIKTFCRQFAREKLLG